jgi:hypothetical protein
MTLQPIDTAEEISGEDFRKNYLFPKRPLILKHIAEEWDAFEKWKLPFFKQIAGNLEVPLYDNSKPSPTSLLNSPDKVMKFGEYLDAIATGPLDLRMFLFNIFDHLPELCRDFSYPEQLMNGFLKKYPMLFFGGAGSIVYLHYDMDLSHVFLTQFHGRKRVLLFENKYSPYLYRLPFTVQSFIDIENPDYEKYPATQFLEGYETVMEHGDTLYIPAGMWHYMNYLEGGYALSLRSFDPSYLTRAKGIFNITALRKFDDMMKKQFGAHWWTYKHNQANRTAEAVIRQYASAKEFEYPIS